jgi:hypothetical protein
MATARVERRLRSGQRGGSLSRLPAVPRLPIARSRHANARPARIASGSDGAGISIDAHDLPIDDAPADLGSK